MSFSTCVSESHEAMSRQAADRILAALTRRADLLFCAAGGSTPIRTYQLLAEHQTRGPEAFRALRVLKLDEWGGLEMSAPGSCEHQLRTHLIKPLGLPDDRYFAFNSNSVEPATECEKVRSRLAQEGPIGLCLLGLGVNGHIALNEPAPTLNPVAHVTPLTEESLRHPMLA